jgi:hypothetical protein
MGERETFAEGKKSGEMKAEVKPDVAKTRAEHAFDVASARAAAQLGKQNAPPQAEISALQKMISKAAEDARVIAQAVGPKDPRAAVSLGSVLSQYVEENPQSRIAALYELAGHSTQWIVSSTTGKAGFNQAAFTAAFKEVLGGTKAAAVDMMVQVASDRTKRSGEISLNHVVDENSAEVLVGELKKQVSEPGAKDPLPVSITYENDSLKYKSRIEPPPQIRDMS